MAVMEAIAAGYLLADFAYHRWIKRPDAKRHDFEFGVPRTEEGAPYSVFHGRCRVRRPVLAWHGTPTAAAGSVANGYPTGTYVYKMDSFFVIGIGFEDGEHQLHNMWLGDSKFSPGFSSLDPETVGIAQIPAFGEEDLVGGQIEWYDGNAAQEHVDSGGSAVTSLGGVMLANGVSANRVSGFRGYVSACLFNGGSDFWYVGSQPTLQMYSFEVSSYGTSHAQLGTYARVGSDSNPINALYDLLVGYFGKLGIASSFIDITSFQAAQYTLHAETHGYSRALEDVQDAAEYIIDILRQIDGVLYEDPTTGTLKIKLIRNDYDPQTIPHITKDNCSGIENFSSSGLNGVPNAIRVVFSDRDRDYNDNSVVAKNSANATGQDTRLRILVKQFPGVTTEAQAYRLAWRELAAESRSIMKCRALLDPSIGNTINPGDAVKLTWTSPDLAGVVFRVAAIDRGTLGDGKVAVELISDYFYVFRQLPPQPGGFEKPDTGGTSGLIIG